MVNHATAAGRDATFDRFTVELFVRVDKAEDDFTKALGLPSGSMWHWPCVMM
mgnify:CR=1 FL=1